MRYFDWGYWFPIWVACFVLGFAMGVFAHWYVG